MSDAFVSGSVRSLFFSLLLVGCGSSPRTTTSFLQRALNTAQPARVVASSHAVSPEWVSGTHRSGAAFIGQGSGRTIAAAKEAAQRDLESSVASYFSVSVASEFEETEVHKQKDGRVEGSHDVRSQVRLMRGGNTPEAEVRGHYWAAAERNDARTFRYYLLGTVSKTAIERAQIRETNKSVVLVEPFRSFDPRLSHALQEELRRRMAVQDNLLVTSTAVDADYVIGGQLERVSGRLVLTYVVRQNQRVLRERRLERDDLFLLEDELVRALSVDLAEVTR